ncbi:MAG: bifunctional pyr operon transcriptional regulator/uracil phosphoribosyltransferase PyrR [Candidatus Izemoplasmatales bacterium]
MALFIEYETIIKTLRRMTHEIIEKSNSLEDTVLIGILNKGYPIAKIIQENILKYEGIQVATVALDISNYRDDEKKTPSQNSVFEVTNKTCIIIDDVLYTGRTVRAAMDALVDMGRPKKVELAVLIDRGHRELPIRPDYIGKNIPTSSDEQVSVRLEGNNPGVFIVKKGEK